LNSAPQSGLLPLYPFLVYAGPRSAVARNPKDLPSFPYILISLLPYLSFSKSFPCHTPKNSPVSEHPIRMGVPSDDRESRDLSGDLSPLAATLPGNYLLSPSTATDPKTPLCKSFACHTSETPRGCLLPNVQHSNLSAILGRFPFRNESLRQSSVFLFNYIREPHFATRFFSWSFMGWAVGRGPSYG
jgi:hypothetical protein